MFSKQKSNDKLPSISNINDVPSIIAGGLKVVGNIFSSGSIEIEGEIEGNVTCSYVSLRHTGKVKGDIVADTVQVDGEVNGLVQGKNINISETGKVVGVVMYESLSIKDGAHIDGQCKCIEKVHSSDVEPMEKIEEENNEEEVGAINEKASTKEKKKVEA